MHGVEPPREPRDLLLPGDAVIVVGTIISGPGTAATIHSAARSLARVCDVVMLMWTGPIACADADVWTSVREGAPDAHMRHFPWCDDFAAARNAAIAAATETAANWRPGEPAWQLACDSDEWIDTHGEDIRAVLATTTADAVFMRSGDGTYVQPRAVNMSTAARFEGTTHEALCGLPGNLPRFLAARFHEHAKSPDEMIAKHARDERILRAVVEREPENARAAFYLANAVSGLGRHAEAVALYDRRSDLGGWDEEAAWACYRAACVLMFDRGQPGPALARCLLGLGHHPGIAELAWVASIACQRLGRHAHAIYWAEIARVHGEGSTSAMRAVDNRALFIDRKGLREGPADVMMHSYRALGLELDARVAEGERAAMAGRP